MPLPLLLLLLLLLSVQRVYVSLGGVLFRGPTSGLLLLLLPLLLRMMVL